MEFLFHGERKSFSIFVTKNLCLNGPVFPSISRDESDKALFPAMIELG